MNLSEITDKTLQEIFLILSQLPEEDRKALTKIINKAIKKERNKKNENHTRNNKNIN